MERTEKQMKRIARMLNEIAGEIGEVEDIKGTIYFFGSELATLRLLKKYRNSDNANAGYSENLERFYFELEPKY